MKLLIGYLKALLLEMRGSQIGKSMYAIGGVIACVRVLTVGGVEFISFVRTY